MGRFGVGGFGKDPFGGGAFGKGQFGVSSGGVQVMIPQATGTPSDNYDVRANVWYDGITSQASGAACVIASGNNAIMTKDWGVGQSKTITGVQVFGSNDADFSGGGGTRNITIIVEGSTDNSSWNLLASIPSFVDGQPSNGFARSKLSGFVTTTAYRYHRVTVTQDGVASDMYVAESQLYETV